MTRYWIQRKAWGAKHFNISAVLSLGAPVSPAPPLPVPKPTPSFGSPTPKPEGGYMGILERGITKVTKPFSLCGNVPRSQCGHITNSAPAYVWRCSSICRVDRNYSLSARSYSEICRETSWTRIWHKLDAQGATLSKKNIGAKTLSNFPSKVRGTPWKHDKS